MGYWVVFRFFDDVYVLFGLVFKSIMFYNVFVWSFLTGKNEFQSILLTQKRHCTAEGWVTDRQTHDKTRVFYRADGPDHDKTHVFYRAYGQFHDKTHVFYRVACPDDRLLSNVPCFTTCS